MSLANVQAQLGNLLAAMPLKVQKVESSFLNNSNPPFEGAIASDSQGQFYVSQINSQGNLAWQQIMDKTSVAQAAVSEFIANFELPVGYEDSTISYGKTLTGDSFSVFIQYEPPLGDGTMYIFSAANMTSTQFDLMVSSPVMVSGGKIHILARGYDAPSGSSIIGTGSQTLPVTVQDQTIDFTLAAATNMSGGNLTLGATASSGLGVTYSITQGVGIASIVAGELVFAGGGDVTVAADQAGDAQYNAAPQVTQTVTVTDDVTDSDGDGTPDINDAFPNDPSETTDTDGDGVGDNADAFPNDPSETTDTDGDGVGDNADAFPNDPRYTEHSFTVTIFDTSENILARTGDDIGTVAFGTDTLSLYVVGSDGWSEWLSGGFTVSIMDTEANILARTGDDIGTIAFATDTLSLYVVGGDGWSEWGVEAPFSNNYSVLFDGNDDYGSAGSVFDSIWSGSFTISLWHKTPSAFSTEGPYGVTTNFLGNDFVPPQGYIEFRYNSTVSAPGKLEMFFSSSGSSNSGINYNTYGAWPTTFRMSPDTWYHLCWVADRPASGTTSSTLYVNGAPQVLSEGVGYLSSIHNSGGTFASETFIARRNQDASPLHLSGELDEMAFFDSAISPSDVSAIYDNGTPGDLEPFSPSHWWRFGDGATYKSTHSLDFDGSSDYVDCGGASTFSFTDGSGNDDPFSVSAWVKLDNTNRARVLAKGGAEFLFGTDGNDRFMLLLWSAGANSSYLYRRSSMTLSAGTWYHLTATYNGSNTAQGITLYVDGEAVAAQDIGHGTYEGMASSSDSLLIGKWPSFPGGSTVKYSDGLTDEVALFDSELPSSDVTAIYNGGAPGDLTPLSPMGWWRMGDDATWGGANWTIPDASENSNAGTTVNMAETSRVTDTKKVVYDMSGNSNLTLINGPIYSTDLPGSS